MRQVQRWVSRHENGNDADRPLKSLPRTGRKPILNEGDINRVREFCSENPFSTATKIREQLHLECSKYTVIRSLHQNGFRCRKPAKKVDITANHAAARLHFAQTNLNRNWQNVIFSDEKVFTTSNDTLKVLWRRKNTRYDVQNVQTTRRSGRISCGVWGWMSAAGPGEIVPITGRLTGDDYRDILEDVFLPSARVLFPDGPLYFVQDNCPIHTSRPVRTWFDNNPEVIRIPWPAKSPDFNVIENLWGLMVRQWNDTIIDNVRTVQNLTQNVCAVWDRLRGTNYCQTMVNSMPERLRDCINNNGYYIKY